MLKERKLIITCRHILYNVQPTKSSTGTGQSLPSSLYFSQNLSGVLRKRDLES